MSNKIQDKFAVLLSGFRTSEGAPRLVIPESSGDAAAMLRSKAGAAAIEARIDALAVERKALKRLGKFMRKHGAALEVASPGVVDGAEPARSTRRPRSTGKVPAPAKGDAAVAVPSVAKAAVKRGAVKTAAAKAAAGPAPKPPGRKPGRPRNATASAASVTVSTPAADAPKPARRPYTRRAPVANAATSKPAVAVETTVSTPAVPAKPARKPRAVKAPPAAPAVSAPSARRTGTTPGRRSGRKSTPST